MPRENPHQLHWAQPFYVKTLQPYTEQFVPAVKSCSSICGGSGSAPKEKANLIWKMQIHKMCFERLAQFYLDVSSYRSTNVLNFSCEVDVERESHSLIWKKQKIRKTGFKAKPDQTKQ